MKNHYAYYYECHFIKERKFELKMKWKNILFLVNQCSEWKNAGLEGLKLDRVQNLIAKRNYLYTYENL